MAGNREMDYVYSLIDKIFRLCIGEAADFSGAMYDGDFSMSLEQAQDRKHRFIAEQLHIGQGARVLDMGCGWGPMLRFFQGAGANGIGLTLSRAQADSCRKAGFEVALQDCRTVAPDMLGRFDAAVSLGAFEHFCSVEDWKAGRQDAIYADFFRTVAALLPAGGRFYLQSMVFGRNVVDYGQIDIHAPRELHRLYPGGHAAPVSRFVASLRVRADRKKRPAFLPDRVHVERQARLHRNDPAMGKAVPELQSPQVCVLPVAHPPLPLGRGAS